MPEYVYAAIDNNVVTNIYVADDSSVVPDGHVRIDNLDLKPGVGFSYQNGTFVAPPPPPPPPGKSVYTQFQFRSLFTLSELIACDNFASSSTLTQEQKSTLNTIIQNFSCAQSIDVKNQSTIYGVQYLASVGLLTTDRAVQILTPGAEPQLNK
jgi:hypothetical protein